MAGTIAGMAGIIITGTTTGTITTGGAVQPTPLCKIVRINYSKIIPTRDLTTIMQSIVTRCKTSVILIKPNETIIIITIIIAAITMAIADTAVLLGHQIEDLTVVAVIEAVIMAAGLEAVFAARLVL